MLHRLIFDVTQITRSAYSPGSVFWLPRHNCAN
jgi:hypothetical protein